MTPARLRSRPLRASFLCLAVAIGSLGCSLELGSAPPPAVDASIPPEIREAISVRQEFGLRSDEAWVRAVAANPDAVMDFGIPMLPFEREQIIGRPGGGDEIVTAVQAYLADHPDIAGGLYLDQARGGIVTMLVTADPAGHEAAVRNVIGPEAPLAVRQVRWTEAELRDLQDRIGADRAFLASIPAALTTTSVDVIDNVTEVMISSADPDAARRIIEHFGAGERLRIISDGTGVLLQPTGRIIGRIIAPPGTDLTSLSPQYEADVDIGPRDAVGIAVAPDGGFVIDRLPPATYTVTILELGGVDNRVAGSATVVIPPGGAVAVEITYEGP
jgi:hypothetical protein